MLLQDYQILGGIFKPVQVVDCNEASGFIVMRGILAMDAKDFYITVQIKRGRLARIVRVAGDSLEEAVANKRELNRIRAEGIRCNEGGLKSFVLNRAVRTIAWCVLMLSFTFGFSLCLTYTLLNGFRGMVVLFGFIFFAAMQLCRHYRMRLISAYPGVAVFNGNH